jgi:hypothetical protein
MYEGAVSLNYCAQADTIESYRRLRYWVNRRWIIMLALFRVFAAKYTLLLAEVYCALREGFLIEQQWGCDQFKCLYYLGSNLNLV